MPLPVSHKMYYLALLCPQEVDKKILQFKHWMRDHFDCTVALKSPAHITLIPPFWQQEVKETELVEALHLFTCDLPAISITLSGFSHFGKKVLFAQVKENPAIEELKNRVEDHFIRVFGKTIKRDARVFHPHVTISSRDVKPPDFDKAWDYFSEKELTISFTTHSISLLKLNAGNWHVIHKHNW
ncbi:MAG: 2'-5' RNA ligase family protein [Chitinophagaceae bacterium]|nr:2'-5' RNA ligase family protein [Chitinophagaceae bacterium]